MVCCVLFASDTLRETSACDEIKINQPVDFEVELKLTKCGAAGARDPLTGRYKPLSFNISSPGIGERVLVNIEPLCECECEHEKATQVLLTTYITNHLLKSYPTCACYSFRSSRARHVAAEVVSFVAYASATRSTTAASASAASWTRRQQLSHPHNHRRRRLRVARPLEASALAPAICLHASSEHLYESIQSNR